MYGYSNSPCDKVTATQSYTPTSLQVTFTIAQTPNVPGCSNSTSDTPGPAGGLDEPTIIAIAATGGALVLIAVILTIIFGVKSIRLQVMPYRDRPRWSKRETEAAY